MSVLNVYIHAVGSVLFMAKRGQMRPGWQAGSSTGSN